jgi:hypothetical protein
MMPIYWSELSRRDDSMTDFFQEWASARNFLEGLPIYTNHRVTIPRYLGRPGSDANDLFVEVNAHPPTSLVLAIPFGTLPYRDALLVWNLLSLAMMIASLVLVWRGLGIPFRPWSIFPVSALTLFCFPLLLHIHFGQLSLLILLLLTGVWAADRSDRPRLAGVLLGAAVTIKLFPGVLFLYFIARKRWRVVESGLLSIASITTLTGLILGFDHFGYYANHIIPRVSKYRGLWFNLSLPGYWTKLFDPPREYPFIQPLARIPILARSATILTCALILMAVWRAARRARSRAATDLSFGLAMTATLLISPITWDHYLLMLMVPLGTTWVQLPESSVSRAQFLAMLVAFWSWSYLIFDLTIPGGIVGGIARPAHTLTIGSYQCYALIALFALQIARLRRLENDSGARLSGPGGLSRTHIPELDAGHGDEDHPGAIGQHRNLDETTPEAPVERGFRQGLILHCARREGV